VPTVRVGSVSDFAPGSLTPVDASGTSVVVARDDDGLCAARNKCPHMGLSLTSGPGGINYEDGVVRCPWHNSRFVVRSGENVDWATGLGGHAVPRWSRQLVRLGRKPAPLTTYPVIVEGDDVYIEL